MTQKERRGVRVERGGVGVMGVMPLNVSDCAQSERDHESTYKYFD